MQLSLEGGPVRVASGLARWGSVRSRWDASIAARSVTVALVATALIAIATSAQAEQSDSAAVAAVVEAYHDALAAGDSVTAIALLAEDAVILEGGGVETREAYRSGHLRSDMRFAAAVRSRSGVIRVVIRGDVAWATSTSVAQGEYRGREIRSEGAELMVLSRDRGGWTIRAIHWSSRRGESR